jgi:tRNA modification GTPase
MISLRGVPVLLTDTAGVRTSEDQIESMGVDRTRRAVADSDLIVFVLDRSQPFTTEDEKVFEEIADNLHLVALNKSDLASFNHFEPRSFDKRSTAVINVSAKTGEGLDNLRAAILEPFNAYEVNDAGLLVTNARHFDLLQRTQAALISSKDLLAQRASEELVLVGLHDALRFLGEITGETTPDDILTKIFATFCIGK